MEKLHHVKYDDGSRLAGCYCGSSDDIIPIGSTPVEIEPSPWHTITQAIALAGHADKSALATCCSEWFTIDGGNLEKLRRILASTKQVAFYFAQPSDHQFFVDMWQTPIEHGGDNRVRFTLQQLGDNGAWSITYVRRLGGEIDTTNGIVGTDERLCDTTDVAFKYRNTLDPSSAVRLLLDAIILARANDLSQLAECFVNTQVDERVLAMLSQVNSIGTISQLRFVPVGLHEDKRVKFIRCYMTFQGRNFDNKVYDAFVLCDLNLVTNRWQIAPEDGRLTIRKEQS